MLDFPPRRSGRGHAHKPPRVPKVREFAQITLVDGTLLSGYVFVEATTRIQDLLNAPQPFFPFVDEKETILLINKNAVVRVHPAD
jgi:hypothetical protein